KLVYHDSYPQTDSLYLPAGPGVESFMLLRSPDSPVRFEFTVRTTDSAGEIAMKDGAVVVTDSDGRGLKLEAPWAIDARRYVSLARWVLDPTRDDGSRRLTLEVVTEGLTYPLIVHTGWRTLAQPAS